MRTGGWIFAPSVEEDDLNGWGKIIRGKDKKGQRNIEEEGKPQKKTERKLGCGLPGSSFYILPIATPKSLIVWPQSTAETTALLLVGLKEPKNLSV